MGGSEYDLGHLIGDRGPVGVWVENLSEICTIYPYFWTIPRTDFRPNLLKNSIKCQVSWPS